MNIKTITLIILTGFFAFSSIAYSKDSTIIIFDASGSMKKKIAGEPKIKVAKEVMGNLMENWNKDIDVGLMVYGHRTKSCNDIEMLVPVGKPEPFKLFNAINKITPKGETPIGKSLKLAAEELNYIESPTTVILVSDGEESCDSDPCAVAKELEKSGTNFTAHIVGFDVGGKSKEKAKNQLKCIAENTGGEFFEAKDANGLKDALEKVTKNIAEPAIGSSDTKGTRDDPIWIEPGKTYESETNGNSTYYKFRIPVDTKAKFNFSALKSKGFGKSVSSYFMEDDATQNLHVSGRGPKILAGKKWEESSKIFTPKRERDYYIYRVSSNSNISFKFSYSLLDYRDNDYAASPEDIAPVESISKVFTRSNKKPGKALEEATEIEEGEIVSGLSRGDRFYKVVIKENEEAYVILYAQGYNNNISLSVLNNDESAKRIDSVSPAVYENIDWERDIAKIKASEESSEYIIKISENGGVIPYEIVYVTNENSLYGRTQE